jgi:hypothetical protein
MRGLQYPTNDEFPGPWMLDQKALKDLETIVLKHWDLLEKRRNQLLDIAVEEEYKKFKKQLSVSPEYVNEQMDYFRRSQSVYSGSYLQFCVQYEKSTYFCEKFEDAFRDRALARSAPEGFAIDFRSGDIMCKVELNKTNGLSISISPQEIQEAQDLYVELDQWINNNRPPYWQRLWGIVADKGFLPYIVALVFLASTFMLMLLFRENAKVLDAKVIAQRLLDQGISESNLPEAVALLLQMQVMDRTTIELPSWFRTVFFGTLFSGVILPIRPKVVLGIGRGSEYLRRWKIWQKIVGITIPSLIFYNFVVPPLN